MGKAILLCLAGLLASAQTPTVIGVANDPPTSPTLQPGEIGYVFGANFGTAENTSVTVGGRKAQVLDVWSNQIRALFPPNVPVGVTALIVTVDGKVSESIDVIVAPPGPRRAHHGGGKISTGPRAPEAPAVARAFPGLPPTGLTPAIAGSGIVYTCDPTITAASANACVMLNTTIAALYSSAFKNANATIYITLGVTDLGMSDWVVNDSSYTNFRNLLVASSSGTNDATAIADSVPAANPFGTDVVELPTSLQRAVGFGPPTTGLTTTGAFCNSLGSAGCYDGIITISNSQPLYFRTGTITGTQYDFFTVAEHETDEVLGTASCALGNCAASTILPADLFRYHSNGTRSFGAGSNNTCSASDSTNACFSLDGVHMLQQYNNVSNGEDAGDWVPNCGSPLVQDYAICAGNAGTNISPVAEILVLDVVGYTLASPVVPLQFYPVAPCRLVDTRGAAAGFNGIAPFSGPSIASGATLTIPVQSAVEATTNTTPAPCGTIPSSAEAYSLNVTVVPHSGAVDYLSLWASGATKPFVATLDDPEGLIVSNAAVVPAGTPSGGISVFNAGPVAADVIIDMNGYFAAPTSLQFYPLAPCRLVDTRGAAAGFNGMDPFAGPAIAAGATLTIPVQSTAEAAADTTPAPCGTISTAAKAYAFNLTVAPHAPGAVDYVTLWASGASKPFVATLNDPEGSIVASAAIVPAGTPSGGVSVFNSGPSSTDVVLDLNGYFAPPSGGLQFYAVAPCRLADTRGAAAGFNGNVPFAGPSIASGGTLTIPVQSTSEASADTEPAPCGVIPSTAQAYSLNITVAPHAGGAVDYVTLWPAGSTQPFVSTLNDPEGLIVSNAAIVPAGASSGGISVFNAGPSITDVIIDMDGYFAP